MEQKSSVLYSPLTSFNWCCKVYTIQQALRAYCPQIYNVIIVVPLLLCKVNSKVTVTLRYTEALKLHCFLKKNSASSRLLAQNRVSQVFWEPIKNRVSPRSALLEAVYLEALLYCIYQTLSYSHLSNKRDVTLTDFGKFHPAQNKNPPCRFIDFIKVHIF